MTTPDAPVSVAILGTTLGLSTYGVAGIGAGTTLSQIFHAGASGVPGQLMIALGGELTPAACTIKISAVGTAASLTLNFGAIDATFESTMLVYDLPDCPFGVNKGDAIRIDYTPLTPTTLSVASLPSGGVIPPMTGAAVPNNLVMIFCVTTANNDDRNTTTLIGVGSGPGVAGQFTPQATYCNLHGSARFDDIAAGEPLTVPVTVTPAAIFTMFHTHWTVAGPAVPVAGFMTLGPNAASPDSAAAIPLVLNQDQIETEHTFYFTAPGEYVITCEVTCTVAAVCSNPAAQMATLTVTVNVVAPTIRLGSYRVNPVVLDTQPASGTYAATPCVAFGAYDPSVNNRPGIQFAATIDSGENVPAGSVRYVQLTRYTVGLNDGATTLSTGGAEFLDTRMPYAAARRLAANDDVVIRAADSPHQSLRPNTTSIAVDQSFRMFVQWQANTIGAIWITLGVIPWFWRANARMTNGVFGWDAGYPVYTSQGIAGGVVNGIPASNELPVWTAVAQRSQLVTGVPLAAGVAINPSVDSPYADEFQQIAFTLQPPAPGQPVPTPTAADLSAALGTPVFPVEAYDRTTYWWTWSTGIDNSGGYDIAWDVLSLAQRTPGLNIYVNPKLPVPPVYNFFVLVAPWCFGTPDVWQKIMNAALPTPDDPVSYDLASFNGKVAAMLPSGAKCKVYGTTGLEMSFPTMPSRDLLNQIAILTQTFSIVQTSTTPPGIMPVPPAPPSQVT